ncbi:EAL domain-containing protein [Vibrio sp. SCSIO 43135]|uniref:EAL domain-containing protein n=1 Tax=Vibrio sp. SCSIO 43135 TaxID=2819096 RepID=UPI0020761FA0|nr:EAL domain-containing protein [Vibrio sp. SCSIO 43135]USD43567.1 EAL domain-containing protein [Vibrio sp. SCSIO 43135]
MSMGSLRFSRNPAGQHRLHVPEHRVVLKSAFQGIFDGKNSMIGVESLVRVSCEDQRLASLDEGSQFESHIPTDVFLSRLDANERSLIEQWLVVLHILNFHTFVAKKSTDCKLFINVSPDTALDIMESPNQISVYRTCLSQFKIDLSRIVFELTEQVCRDEERFRELAMTKWLPKVHRALDDVCLRDIELGRILNLEPSIIKLDRSLTRLESTDTLLVKSVQAWRKEGIIVVAEGIETTEDFERMKSVGCHWFQGYLLGKPYIFGDKCRTILKVDS